MCFACRDSFRRWLLCVLGFAFFVSPRTWTGTISEIHIHVYSAILLGGVNAALPIYLIFKDPGAVMNRMVVAVSQILFSVLFIHLMGGRLETHFHIFGSLAFLAIYRDLRPLVIATAITTADHILRGVFWPQSVYGILSATPWRAFEHAAWVLFEDAVLFYSIKIALSEMYSVAENQVGLEDKTEALQKAHDEVAQMSLSLEEKVRERTKQLEESQLLILNQQQSLITTSKMSALGEMAGGVAHEINTPLAVIAMRIDQMEECILEGDMVSMDFVDTVSVIRKTVDRIAKIVSGLRFFAREERRGPPQNIKLSTLVEDTLGLCGERFSNHGVGLEVVKNDAYRGGEMECRSIEISQVLLNLLNNAFDAVMVCKIKWIRLEIFDLEDFIKISITDSGPGIPEPVRDKIMQPFFTTKELGKGTGLGLSISKGIIEGHQGTLCLESGVANTCFMITMPKTQGSANQAGVA